MLAALPQSSFVLFGFSEGVDLAGIDARR